MNKRSISYLQFLVAIIMLCCVGFYTFGKKNGTEQKIPDTSSQSPLTTINTKEWSSDSEKNLHIKSEKTVHQQHALAKPGAAVSLKNTKPLYAATPGVYEYQLVLASPGNTGKMMVDASVGNGISIVSSERHFEFELQENGEYVVPLTLSASAEGRFYIQLQVSIAADGDSSSRVIAAILQVGEPAVKGQKAATMSAETDAEAVISLPAQETISPR